MEHAAGPLLVLAGAGSGKTRVITSRIAHLIRKNVASPERILAVTFTNKAAREMRDRVEKLVGSAGSRTTISTFHSFGCRLIRAHASLLGLNARFSIYDREDQLAVLRSVQSLFDDSPQKEDMSQLLLGAIGRFKNQGKGPAEARADAGDEESVRVAMTYTRYQELLRSRNAVDLDDLLLLSLRLVTRDDDAGAALRQRYDHVLVDEYQDTNRVQYLIVRALTEKHRNLCVVGDDDQAIYGWRGADVRNILSFRSDWNDAIEVKLERNYRSTTIILAAANAVIEKNPSRTPKKLRAENAGGEKLDFVIGATATEEAERVVARLERRRREGAKWSDLAILYRANHLSRAFEDALRSRAVPYHLVGGHGFYERREVRDLLAYLRLLANPDDRVSFERIVNVPRRGIGPSMVSSVEQLSRSHRLSLEDAIQRAVAEPSIRRGAREKLHRFHALIRRHRASLREGKGLAHTLRLLSSEIGYEGSLLKAAGSEDEAEARTENTRELVRALAEYEARASSSSIDGFLERISLLTDADRNDAGRRGVTLMTLHAAKGLEFPHVALVGCEDGLLPSRRALEEGPSAENEERRLVYVGITRARESLLISAAASRISMGRILRTELSRYIDEIPPELFSIAPRSIEARHRRTETGRGGQSLRRGAKRPPTRSRRAPRRGDLGAATIGRRRSERTRKRN
ncbi:MAG: ATP-dependent DNA helicase Rep [Gemmatimonadetes bacterium]|nr:ATP-dependent DNA helicase Rep [Gemmatimonadota bacterium]